MRIVVSACLLGRDCKYNGGNNRNDKLIESLAGHDVIEVCPEVAGGLPTPRVPSEIRGDRVVNAEGADVTAEFERGARECVAQCQGVDLAILQPRSPSCGATEVYDGTFSKTLVSGKGLFAQALANLGIRCLDVDDPEAMTLLQ